MIAGAEKDTLKVLDVENLISAGESERLEFKSSAPWDYKEGRPNKTLEHVIAKTVAAFLNSKGSVLLIGVGDDGQILGLERDLSTFSKKADRDGYQQFLVNLFSNSLGKENSALLAISFKSVQGSDVCVVEAQPSLRPVYAKIEQASKFYVRVAATTQELDVQQSHDYMAARFQR